MKKEQKTIRFHILLGKWFLRMDDIYSMRDFVDWLDEIEMAAINGEFGHLDPTDLYPRVIIDPDRLYEKAKSTRLITIPIGLGMTICPDPADWAAGIGLRGIKQRFSRKKAKRIVRVRCRVRKLLLGYAKSQTKGNPYEAILGLSFLRESLFKRSERHGASP